MSATASEKAQQTPSPAGSGSRSEFGWLNRTIVGIGLASLFSDIGHEMATATMPALLASFGSSSLLLGTIEGVSDAASSFAKLYSGLYSDRLRRRKSLAVVGYFFTAAGMASFTLATRGWHVLIGRVVGWLGRGARTPVRNVLLTEATTSESYGRAFGLERAMDSAGAVIGPLIALVVLHRTGVRSVFAYTLIPGVIAALTVGVLVREKPHEAQPHARLLSGVRALPAGFRRFLVGVGIAGLGDFSNALLILWATQAWTPRFGRLRAAVLAMSFYVGYNVVYALSCYASGVLADRFPKRLILAGGYAFAVVPAIALLCPGASLLKFAFVFAGSGIYMGVWETVEGSTAASYLPDAIRGVGFGTLATVNGIGDLVSSVLVGGLWVASPTLAMSTVIATSIVGAAFIASNKQAPTDGKESRRGASRKVGGAKAMVYCTTDVGLVRDSNEDAFVVSEISSGREIVADREDAVAVTDDGVLLMVCDGMGGAAAGEVAARLAGETVSKSLFGQRGLIRDFPPQSALMSALRLANQVIFEESRHRKDERGMGTTCTAGLLLPGRLVIAQVGDSRAYLWRHGGLKQLTRDQSLAMAMVDAGVLAPADVTSFPHANVILQALGIEENVLPTLVEVPIEPDDVILFCSDGLHGPVPESALSTVLEKHSRLPVAARALIRAALDAGGPDNVTVILARCGPTS